MLLLKAVVNARRSICRMPVGIPGFGGFLWKSAFEVMVDYYRAGLLSPSYVALRVVVLEESPSSLSRPG